MQVLNRKLLKKNRRSEISVILFIEKIKLLARESKWKFIALMNNLSRPIA